MKFFSRKHAKLGRKILSFALSAAMVLGAGEGMGTSLFSSVLQVSAAPGDGEILNFSELGAQTISTVTTIGNFTIYPHPAGTEEKNYTTIDSNKKTIDGIEYSLRFKLAGTGSKEARSVKYTAAGAGTLSVGAISGSSSADRPLVVAKSDGTEVARKTALGASATKLDYTITEAGDYYIYSGNSGINLYFVKFTPAAPAGTPIAGTIQYDGADIITLSGTSASPVATPATYAFTSEPDASKLSLSGATYVNSVTLEGGNITVKKDSDVVISIPYSVSGQLNAPANGFSNTYDFPNTFTGTAPYLSEDGFLSINSTSAWTVGSGHGLKNNGQITFTVKVPGNTRAVFTYNDCRYSNENTVSMYVNDSVSPEQVKTTADSTTKNVTDGSAVFNYDNSTADVVTLKFVTSDTPNDKYIHGVSYQITDIPQVATVTGNVTAALSGATIKFSGTAGDYTATVAADGSYSIVLPVGAGADYTVTVSGVAGYRLATDAKVNLVEVAAGSTVADKNFTPLSWNAAKTGTITVGGSTFTIKAGASEETDFEVSCTAGNGSVELITPAEAIIWANLNGDGKGTVGTVDKTGDIASASVSGNTITLTFTGTDLPASYKLTVKDNSASGQPAADGSLIAYDFKNGSVVSKLYDGTKKSISGGKSVSSSDKLIELIGNGKIYYNGTTHGIALNASDVIKVKVAGNADIDFVMCNYSNASSKISAASDTGSVKVKGQETAEANMKASADGETVSFHYEGSATTLTFTVSGTSYIHSMTVTNAAPSTNTNPGAASKVPSVENWSGGKLSASIAGQKIVLSNPTQSVKKNVKTSGLGMYVFPLTADNNTLSVDILVGSDSGSNNNLVLLGLFNESGTAGDDSIRMITTGIRNTTYEVVQIISKVGDSKVMDKNSFNGPAMEAGDLVNLTISRDGSNIIQTFTNKTKKTETQTKTTSYANCLDFKNPGGEVYYGLMIANKPATITNMLYTAADGTVLFDQNTYYDPLGTAPVVSAVTAAAAADRTKITVEWTGDAAQYDGKYVLQVKKPGASEWTDVATELTVKTYDYLVNYTESGEYQFRVCGTLGNSASQNLSNRNAFVESNKATIEAALAKPVLTLEKKSSASKVELTWDAVSNATSYEVYRRYDDVAAEKIATVTTNSYTDTAITAEVPYYYTVKAISADNFSPESDEMWTLPTAGHSGYYDESVSLNITKRSFTTVFDGKFTIAGTANAAGTMTLKVNSAIAGTCGIASAGASFEFNDIALSQGRNTVELMLSYGGKVTRKVLNYVYLTNYDLVVDAAWTGADGADYGSTGKKVYKTVGAAIDAASADQTILVRNGDYNEQLVISKKVHLIGEDSEKTRIHFASCNDHVNGSSRYAMNIKADGFTAENICIENSWAYDGGSGNESAEAIAVESNNVEFVGCRLISNQDTVLVKNQKYSYFSKCFIYGNVDFIWGEKPGVVFDDCDIQFRYAAKKNAGYVTAFGNNEFAIFNNCRFTADESCGGAKYYLARPYKTDSKLTFIDCYMGSIINKDYAYSTWSGNQMISSDPAVYEGAQYFEKGTYGPGFDVNINRRQISAAAANAAIAAAKSKFDYVSATVALGNKYSGSVVTPANPGFVENSNESTKYSQYEGNDAGLGKYQQEGFAASSATTGGGLLKETNENYYKVATGDEFLAAMKAIYDKKGVASVIEVTADLNLGYNEISEASKAFGTNIVNTHNPALLNPALIASGVSKVYIKNISNLTIFSKNGATIKHAALDISASSNVIIRNLTFDELWEWDEKTSGDYDVNDWDYMTIENGSNRIWVDHCTFYKAYDGVIDIKNSASYASQIMNVTVSWCSFLPGSKNNTFFNEMMEYLDANKNTCTYYKSLLKSGMTKEQIRLYAFGQKKTHLLGQDDGATANTNLRVTFANNYYLDSMDRMPRLRFGVAHVYNCIMDSQELLDARRSITNADAAKHIVSNGAASTCDGKVLLESCYINGIQNALNSGNGSSPSGYIAASETLYYVDGIRYSATPKVNTTKVGEALKVTDKTSFIAGLPYSEYGLYDAAQLANKVKPYAGSGKLDLTVLQWEKSEYNDTGYTKPTAGTNYNATDAAQPVYQIPSENPTPTPTPTPSQQPSADPTPTPSVQPSADPTPTPSEQPSSDSSSDSSSSSDDNYSDNGMKAYATGTNGEKVTSSFELTKTGLGSNVPIGASLTATGLNANTKEYKQIIDKVQNVINTANAFIYDLKLKNILGKNVQPNGTISITVDIPAGISSANVVVYRVNDDDTYTKLKTTVKNGKVTFETDHFSYYIITEDVKSVNKSKAAQTGMTFLGL